MNAAVQDVATVILRLLPPLRPRVLIVLCHHLCRGEPSPCNPTHLASGHLRIRLNINIDMNVNVNVNVNANANVNMNYA